MKTTAFSDRGFQDRINRSQSPNVYFEVIAVAKQLLASVVLVAVWTTGTARLADAQESKAPGKIEPVEPNLGRPVDFQKDIQPILDDKCVSCHNVAILESRLNLETVPLILKGGKRGPAVVPRDVQKSLLYQVAARAVEPAMPPIPNTAAASVVTPKELGLLKAWIEEGAAASASSGRHEIFWQSIPANVNCIYSVALSTWGRWVACGRANQIDVYDVCTGEFVQRLQDPALRSLKKGEKPFYPAGAAHRDFVHALALNPEGTMLASAGYREVKLWQRPTNVQRSQFPQDQAVTSLALSSDGKWMAVGRQDHSLLLQSLMDPNQRKVLAGHAGPITSIQFTADSGRVFSGSSDKTIRAWSVNDGQQTGVLETPQEVTCLALNADGSKVFSGHNWDHIIRGWNVPFDSPKPAEGDKPAEPVKPIVEMKGHGAPVTAVAVLAPGGSQLVSTSADNTWRVWEIANGQQASIQNNGAPITALSVRSDGQMLVTVGENHTARLWKIDRTPVAEMKGNIAAHRRLLKLTDDDVVAKSRMQSADAAFKAAEKNFKEREDGTKKATEQKDTKEKALNEAKAKESTATQAVEAAKTELDAKPDDEGLKKKKADADAALVKESEAVKKAQEALDAAAKAVVQSQHGQQLADDQQKHLKQLLDHESNSAKQAESVVNQARADQPALDSKSLKSAAFVADGKLIATAGEDGVIRLWSGTNGKPVEELTGQNSAVTLLAAGQDRSLFSVGQDGKIIVWDANPPWALSAVLGPPPEDLLDLSQSKFINRVLSLAFSPDGKLLATGGGEPSRGGELLLWDVASKSIVRQFVDAHSDTVLGLEFSRDGKYLVSGAADKFVKQFDVESAKLIRAYEGHTNHVLGVSFKADSSRIVSAGADNSIKVWNTETGEQVRTIQNYSKQVTSIRYIGASDNIISSSGDKSVKMHRTTDGGNYRNFVGATDYVNCVAVTRDESLAIGGGEDGTLWVWNGTNGQELFRFAPPKPPAESSQASTK